MADLDKSCNLECVKDNKSAIEFVGPVKIVLVDPPKNQYMKQICAAAFIVIAHMMIGVTTMTIFYYSLTYKLKLGANLHVFLCTAGYQLCLPEGILMVNKFNGASYFMRTGGKRCQHMLLQFFGLVFAFCGSFAMYFFDGKSLTEFLMTLHSLSGLLAGCLGAVNMLFGIIVHCTNKGIHTASKFLHILLGVSTLASATLCFVLGLLTPPFMSWIAVPEMFTITVSFCVISTIIVLMSPICNFMRIITCK